MPTVDELTAQLDAEYEHIQFLRQARAEMEAQRAEVGKWISRHLWTFTNPEEYRHMTYLRWLDSEIQRFDDGIEAVWNGR
ncbi:MAG: hypothetical protein UZ13_02009 [Chloroflexi bacterium OLB13]|nr:MAG: hypothetical protein UZ13_02009 [Chloroflexi bacterium OLB13]